MAIKLENRLNIWKFEEYYRWYRIDKKIVFFFRKLKWMLQRAKYGYCDRDIWSLDHTLGNYIAVTVNELAKTIHGYPPSLTEEEWTRILQSIANDFYIGTNEDCWNNPYEEELCYDELYSELSEEKQKIWDKFFLAEEENQLSMSIRRQEGFNLLEKWFVHLWD